MRSEAEFLNRFTGLMLACLAGCVEGRAAFGPGWAKSTAAAPAPSGPPSSLAGCAATAPARAPTSSSSSPASCPRPPTQPRPAPCSPRCHALPTPSPPTSSAFYSDVRPHSALGGCTPAEAYGEERAALNMPGAGRTFRTPDSAFNEPVSVTGSSLEQDCWTRRQSGPTPPACPTTSKLSWRVSRSDDISGTVLETLPCPTELRILYKLRARCDARSSSVGHGCRRSGGRCGEFEG